MYVHICLHTYTQTIISCKYSCNKEKPTQFQITPFFISRPRDTHECVLHFTVMLPSAFLDTWSFLFAMSNTCSSYLLFLEFPNYKWFKIEFGFTTFVTPLNSHVHSWCISLIQISNANIFLDIVVLNIWVVKVSSPC